ncbi:5-methylcytosine-specific restriction endonuclease McrA [Neobacillus sp. B4I6]|uniref:HNH endonuclease n=1 Tax=Neobacillus sp. B4I6 TaxID=3373925 RepID=UPI003D192C8E
MKDLKKELRQCRICNEVKQLETFEIDKRCNGLYSNRCKSCKTKSTDKGNHAFYKLKQRAEKAGSKVELTLDEVKALFGAFSGECIYCGAQEEPDGSAFHLEHVIPRSQGGRDHISNLVISCKSCNSKKGNRPVIDFYLSEESFTEENFHTLVQYIALSSEQPVKELFDSLVTDHALYLFRKEHEVKVK